MASDVKELPLKRFIIVLAAAAIAAAPLHAQDVLKSEPLTIGTSYVVSTHGAERRINIVLPADYSQNDKTYPLVLMLDGGLRQDFFLTLGMERWNQLWQRSEPVIFVGIETVDRQRELLPPTSIKSEQERYPAAGESASFRDWLSTFILPLLRDRYRDDGRAFLVGESAAGHFVVETWALEPDLFNGHAAISPSLQWNDQKLSRRLSSIERRDRPPLFISLANEAGATEEGITRLMSTTGSNVCFADRRTELVHANTLHGLFPEALQYLLPTEADWLDDYGLTVRCEDEAGE